MRFLKRALTAVTLLLLVAFGTIYGLAQRELGRTYAVARKAPPRATDSLAVARGEHLATSISKCADCHGADWGQLVIDDAALGGSERRT
jgi:mono/diheme cytochrome c family protein